MSQTETTDYTTLVTTDLTTLETTVYTTSETTGSSIPIQILKKSIINFLQILNKSVLFRN